MARCLVLGAGGFIGGHLVRRLKQEGHWVRGVDRFCSRHAPTAADDFRQVDLRDAGACQTVFDGPFDEVYHLAAEMGGAGFVFSGDHDAAILSHSATITLNVLACCRQNPVGRLFYASSACVYPQQDQAAPDAPPCREDSAYPANPDSDYGWEKLFAERLCLAHARNHGLTVRIARYHNIFGPEGSWGNGREKAPAALCRKVAAAPDGGVIDVWGDGEQTRSFLYIDDCLDGTLRLMRSAVSQPLNIGSAERISINQLACLIADIAGKTLTLRHHHGPLGVRGRSSDNTLARETLDWSPSIPLRAGLEMTYRWIAAQIAAGRTDAA